MMIGEKIRQVRQSQERSLADVAKKAKMSIATLSRIENGKQTLELGTFLTLSRVLDVSPQDLLGEDGQGEDNGIDPLVKKIAAFDTRERVRLWRELAAARRTRQAKSRRSAAQMVAQQVEELLAQIDFMRDELESVRKRIRTTSR